MKLFIVAALFVAAALAAPANPEGDAQTIFYNTNNIGVNDYQVSYATSNGIFASEQALLKNVGTENEGIEVRGQYSYIGDDGKNYTITYIANDAGYQPQGAHIPQ